MTLIIRPWRFGKTLNLDMLERFFSIRYKDQGQVFEGLSIWEEEKYRRLQGTYPVTPDRFLHALLMSTDLMVYFLASYKFGKAETFYTHTIR